MAHTRRSADFMGYQSTALGTDEKHYYINVGTRSGFGGMLYEYCLGGNCDASPPVGYCHAATDTITNSYIHPVTNTNRGLGRDGTR